MKKSEVTLKALAVLGALVYVPLTVIYPLEGVLSGRWPQVKPTICSVWLISAFGLLTLLPNAWLNGRRSLRRGYATLAVLATALAFFALLERLNTNWYGDGNTPRRVLAVLGLFALHCCGWLSFWCHRRRLLQSARRVEFGEVD